MVINEKETTLLTLLLESSNCVHAILIWANLIPGQLECNLCLISGKSLESASYVCAAHLKDVKWEVRMRGRKWSNDD